MQAMLSTRHSSNGRGYDIHNVYSAFRKVMMRVRIPVFHLIFIIFVAFFCNFIVCLFVFVLVVFDVDVLHQCFLLLFFSNMSMFFFFIFIFYLFFVHI